MSPFLPLHLRLSRFGLVVSFFFAIPFLAVSGRGAFMPLGALKEAAAVSREDGVGSGWCGRGVWSVLTALGYGEGIRSANGQDWETVLHNAGWTPLRCLDPSMAPFGSVLVYLSDMRLQGRNVVGTKGGVYGHVELVGIDEGKRSYISDRPRPNPGGTVPHNFTRRAWVPPGYVPRSPEYDAAVAAAISRSGSGSGRPVVLPQSSKQPVLQRSSYDPAAISRSAKELLEERLSLAEVVFTARSL